MRRLWSFFITLLAGIWLGAGILAKADAEKLSGLLGLLLCLYVITVATAPTVPAPARLEPVLSPVMGAASGVIAGLTGSILIPGIVYLQALELGRDGLVQAMGIAFWLAALGLATAFWGHGQLPTELGLASAAATVPAIAGMLLGQRIRGRLDEKRFRQVFLAALLLLGLHLASKAFF